MFLVTYLYIINKRVNLIAMVIIMSWGFPTSIFLGGWGGGVG